MTIRRLPNEVVNRIAAGEVVERPASAVKELVENAIDARATRVEVEVDGGGLTRILVADNGIGLSPEDLSLAVERHATSKLAVGEDGELDLLRIATLGFRGEALPSIGSVARLTIAARTAASGDAYAIRVEGGAVTPVAPAAFAQPTGARVEVRDLFYATPARLKFMKSERSESMAIADEVKRQAMAHPTVAFSLDIDGRKVLRLPAEPYGPEGRLARLAAVLGRDFHDNAMSIDQEREGVSLSGFAGLATYNRGNAAHQYLFVNGRPVRDRLLQGALRGAYADFLARDRHPLAALYVELDASTATLDKLAALGRFLDQAHAADAAWTVYLLALGPLVAAFAAASVRSDCRCCSRSRSPTRSSTAKRSWRSRRQRRYPSRTPPRSAGSGG